MRLPRSGSAAYAVGSRHREQALFLVISIFVPSSVRSHRGFVIKHGVHEFQRGCSPRGSQFPVILSEARTALSRYGPGLAINHIEGTAIAICITMKQRVARKPSLCVKICTNNGLYVLFTWYLVYSNATRSVRYRRCSSYAQLC